MSPPNQNLHRSRYTFWQLLLRIYPLQHLALMFVSIVPCHLLTLLLAVSREPFDRSYRHATLYCNISFAYIRHISVVEFLRGHKVLNQWLSLRSKCSNSHMCREVSQHQAMLSMVLVGSRLSGRHRSCDLQRHHFQSALQLCRYRSLICRYRRQSQSHVA